MWSLPVHGQRLPGRHHRRGPRRPHRLVHGAAPAELRRPHPRRGRIPRCRGRGLVGIGLAYGYFAFCILAALVIAALPQRAGRGYTEESAVIGTVQAFALASGMLFVALYKGFLNGTNALLFGSFLGITVDPGASPSPSSPWSRWRCSRSSAGRCCSRPSTPTSPAPTACPPVPWPPIFLVLLGVTAAEVSQITGALLVFALLVLPPATAQLITPRPVYSVALSVGIGRGHRVGRPVHRLLLAVPDRLLAHHHRVRPVRAQLRRLRRTRRGSAAASAQPTPAGA